MRERHGRAGRPRAISLWLIVLLALVAVAIGFARSLPPF
jgi:hypothetical protein